MATHGSLTLKDELFERVAKLMALNVPVKQIAEAIGLSEDRVFAICREDAVKEKVAALQTQSLEQMQTINDGWDALEEMALGHVVEYMAANPDPDFALRAAQVANKAERRGYLGARAINGGTGASTVINLQVGFVQRLQAMRETPVPLGAAKRVDSMTLGDAEKLLTDGIANDVVNIFAESPIEIQQG